MIGLEETATGWLLTVDAPRPAHYSPCGHSDLHRHGTLAPRRAPHGAVGLRPVTLTWVPRRWRCVACRQTVCPRPAWLRPWQRWTPAAQEAALILLREANFRSVARLLGVTDNQLRRLVDRVVPRADTTWWDQPGDLVLSLDEHSFRGQDLLITVALHAPERRLLAILPDDRLRSLETWLAAIPEAVRTRIRAVTVDLKRADARVVRRWCPAAQVLADPFHLLQDANRRLDEIRRLEQAEVRTAIPRWPLVKGHEHLTPRQQAQLGDLLARWPALGQLYHLKEDLRALFRAQTPAEARQAWERWILNAEACDHAEGMVWARTIRRWCREIQGH
ncbi:MAG: ISL3 family transposase [Firmicutes bacterium]|nr:ISL3 family transposase [Alicyclobacillaceae bacterium]MCL6497040.1 ISL3 family transposase [Bacillota bacterium]